MRRWVRYGALILLALASTTAAHAETLSICYEKRDAYPWRTVGGTGLDFDLLKHVEQKVGLKFKVIGLPWKRCLAKLQANEMHGAFSVSFARDRVKVGAYPGGAEKPDASKRMHNGTYVVVRKKGNKVSWDGRRFSNLNGPVVYQLGYSVADRLHDLNVPTLEMNKTVIDIANGLIEGWVPAAAVFSSDIAPVMETPIGAKLEILSPPLVEKPYFLMLSHSLVKNRPDLARKLWDTVEEVRNSPAYTRQKKEVGVVQD
jgi:polar amino acid transport system substrate-binding protein